MVVSGAAGACRIITEMVWSLWISIRVQQFMLSHRSTRTAGLGIIAHRVP